MNQQDVARLILERADEAWRWNLPNVVGIATTVDLAREYLALAARVAALEHELEQARDQETMWRERWEERHARVAALEHAVEEMREILRANVGDAYNLLTQGESPTQRRGPSAQRIYDRNRDALAGLDGQ